MSQDICMTSLRKIWNRKHLGRVKKLHERSDQSRPLQISRLRYYALNSSIIKQNSDEASSMQCQVILQISHKHDDPLTDLKAQWY